jgi:hypothetical protein
MKGKKYKLIAPENPVREWVITIDKEGRVTSLIEIKNKQGGAGRVLTVKPIASARDLVLCLGNKRNEQIRS